MSFAGSRCVSVFPTTRCIVVAICGFGQKLSILQSDTFDTLVIFTDLSQKVLAFQPNQRQTYREPSADINY